MDNRAVSDVVGAITLVGLVTIATTVIGVGIVFQTYTLGEQSEKTYVTIDSEVNATAVSIQHIGGSELNTSTTEILLVGDSDREGPYKLNSTAVTGSGLSDNNFSIGDTATVSHSFEGLIDIYVFSTETDEQLYYTVQSTSTESLYPEGPTASNNTTDSSSSPGNSGNTSGGGNSGNNSGGGNGGNNSGGGNGGNNSGGGNRPNL